MKFILAYLSLSMLSSFSFFWQTSKIRATRECFHLPHYALMVKDETGSLELPPLSANVISNLSYSVCIQIFTTHRLSSFPVSSLSPTFLFKYFSSARQAYINLVCSYPLNIFLVRRNFQETSNGNTENEGVDVYNQSFISRILSILNLSEGWNADKLRNDTNRNRWHFQRKMKNKELQRKIFSSVVDSNWFRNFAINL